MQILISEWILRIMHHNIWMVGVIDKPVEIQAGVYTQKFLIGEVDLTIIMLDHEMIYGCTPHSSQIPKLSYR